VSFIDTPSKYVLWFKLSNSITKCGDVLYGVIYMPPEGSLYYNGSAFVEIQSELDSLSDNYTLLWLEC